MSVFFSILLPGLYVALQEFHYSMIPLRFLITVMTSVNGIPLSPLTEVLFVILLFEIIREASVRMPRAVGMAMSIVGRACAWRYCSKGRHNQFARGHDNRA